MTLSNDTPPPVEADEPEGELSRPGRPFPDFALCIRTLAFVALVCALYFGRPFLVPVVIALLLWLLLRPVVRLMHEKLRLPIALSAGMVVLGLVGGAVGALTPLAEPAKKWIDEAPTALRQMETRLGALKRKILDVRQATDKLDKITEIAEQPRELKVSVRPEAISSRLLAGTQSFIVSAFAVLVLVFFLLSSGDMFLRKLVRVSPGLRNKIRAVEVANDVEQEVGRYLLAVAAVNFGLGVVTAAAMALLGMPNPILWGAMVAIFNFVPYVGAMSSTLILSVVALMTFNTLAEALTVPAVFLAITAIEGQIVQPMIVGRQCSINTVLIFLALMFWGWLWGVAGILVAVPILVVLKVICAHIEGLATIHEFLDGERDKSIKPQNDIQEANP